MWRLAIVLCLTGCLDFGPCPVDAHGEDLVTADAPPGRTRFVVSHLATGACPEQLVPPTGLDLDGDGYPNNKLGGLVDLRFGVDGFRAPDVEIASGQLVVLLALDNDVGSATVRLFQGEPVATPPRFDGGDRLQIDPASPVGTFEGTVADGVFDGAATAPVTLTVPLLMGIRMTVPLQAARFRTGIASDGCRAGGYDPPLLGGAIKQEDIAPTVVSAFAAGLTALIAEECPSCPCPDGSLGSNLELAYDPNADCLVTTDDLLTAPFQDRFFAPDFGLTDPGVADSLSFGVVLDCVPATFAIP